MNQTLDVRPDLAAGREPFSRIMKAAENVEPGGSVTVIAPFEPVPLYGVLGGQGFSHETHQLEEGAWQVTFTREKEPGI